MGKRQQIDRMERRSLIDDALAIHAILSGEGDVGIAEVVDLGQRGIDVGQFRLGRCRVLRGAAQEKGIDLAIGMPQLIEQSTDGIAQVGQHAAGTAPGRTDDVDARIAVAQGESRLRNRLINVVRIGRFLDLALEPGQQPLLIVGKGQSSQSTIALRLQRTGQSVQLLARQPFAEHFEIAPAIIADRLQRQMIELATGQGDVAGVSRNGKLSVRIGIDAQESQERQLVQVAEAIQESAAQFEQRLPPEASQPDDDRRPQCPGVRLHDA